jgi:thiol-disulfide isomerase/thioredoxin
MKTAEGIRKYRSIITMILALTGIGIMMYYDHCDTACSYLKGDILGMDLKWVGVAFMAAIMAFAAFRQTSFVRALLAGGLGVEAHLYAFQLQNDVYCPFCLVFSALVIVSFLINYELPSAWHENRRRMWLYFLGEVNFPMFKINKLPLLIVSVLGYLVILFSFSGSVTPAYGQDKVYNVPSLGQGACEVTLFTDYFCLPCRMIDSKAEPLFKELLATGQVKIRFIDVPFTRMMPVYAKYYLYAANARNDADYIFYVRGILFEAAQTRNIRTEEALVAYLKEKNIVWKAFDEKSVFPVLNEHFKDNKIDATPTCVIKYSSMETRKYVGTDQIWDGLIKLKEKKH